MAKACLFRQPCSEHLVLGLPAPAGYDPFWRACSPRPHGVGIWYHLYVESKRNDTSECIYKTEIDSDIENKLMVIEGERMVG